MAEAEPRVTALADLAWTAWLPLEGSWARRAPAR